MNTSRSSTFVYILKTAAAFNALADIIICGQQGHFMRFSTRIMRLGI